MYLANISFKGSWEVIIYFISSSIIIEVFNYGMNTK